MKHDPASWPLDEQSCRILLARAAPGVEAEANQVCSLVQRLLYLIPVPDIDRSALQLAILALQLAGRRRGTKRKPSSINWRQNTDDAAEILAEVPLTIPQNIVESAIDLLRQLRQSAPATQTARLLADALNLNDFGITGLIRQALAAGLRGNHLNQLIISCHDQQQYRYWEARLAQDFHFDAVRQLARQRLTNLHQILTMLDIENEIDRQGITLQAGVNH